MKDMLPNSRVEFQQQWLGLLQLDPCDWSFQASIDEKHGALFCRHSWSEKNDNWPDEAVDSRFTTRGVGNHEHMGATALHGEPSDLEAHRKLEI